jgi:hypothetical protein
MEMDREVDKSPWYGLLLAMVNQAQEDLTLPERESRFDFNRPTHSEKQEAEEFLRMMRGAFGVWLNEEKYVPHLSDRLSECGVWQVGYCRKNCASCLAAARSHDDES